MELSGRFVNTIRILNGQADVEQAQADWEELMEGWLPHLLFEDDADFSWVKSVPMLTDHTTAQKLARLESPAKLLVFKDLSGIIIGKFEDTNQFMSFTKEDMEDPTSMAILCVASTKLQMAIHEVAKDMLDEGEPNTQMSGAGQESP